MEKKSRYYLSEVQVQALERAMHNDDRAEVALRCAAIRQLHLGEKPSDVAQQFVVCRTTVYRWWNLYCAGGIDALSNRPKSGRPPKTDAAYWQRLEELINEDPRKHNYVFVVWTTGRLRDHMEVETGISVSAAWLRERMKKLGFVFRRPKKDLRHLQDPQQREAADEWLKDAKKKPVPQRISSFSLWTKAP